MGGRGGPLWKRITYRLPASPADAQASPLHSAAAQQQQQHLANGNGHVHAGEHSSANGHANGTSHSSSSDGSCSQGPGVVVEEDAWGRTRQLHIPFFQYLKQLLASHKLVVSEQEAQALPFNFWGGLVGYLGYELKAECGGSAAHASPTPDAALLFADRLLAVDHHTGQVYALAVASAAQQAGAGSQAAAEAKAWVDGTVAQVMSLGAVSEAGEQAGPGPASSAAVDNGGKGRPFGLRHSRQRYMENVAASKRCGAQGSLRLSRCLLALAVQATAWSSYACFTAGGALLNSLLIGSHSNLKGSFATSAQGAVRGGEL